ncbi:zinc finger protein 862-like [Hydra vulgaris]|uniref:zinc finger protein 862-like n=1 Tax=Hydra vulgaris TaxID=6087 RepID=UPI0032EA0D76
MDANKDHRRRLSTVKKWEKLLICELEYDLNGDKVIRLRCSLCKKFEKRISQTKLFSMTWIKPGTISIKKDSLAAHLSSAQHKEAMRIHQQTTLGSVSLFNHVIHNTPIGCGLRKMAVKDADSLRKKFNIAYYLAKRERPFTDYPYLIALEKTNGVTNLGVSYGTDRAAAIFTDYIGTVIKNKLTECLKNCRFYCVLCDGSTYSAVSEQELIYILYLKDGSSKVEFLSIETAENSNAVGLKKCITDAFTRVGITNSYKHLLGVNLDGANVNLGAYAGLGALLKEGSPWLEIVHCFNHRLELALKDAFESLSAFKTVDKLLLQLYYLYQKSPKRYRELQGLAEAWGNSVPKPTNACGTR